MDASARLTDYRSESIGAVEYAGAAFLNVNGQSGADAPKCRMPFFEAIASDQDLLMDPSLAGIARFGMRSGPVSQSGFVGSFAAPLAK